MSSTDPSLSRENNLLPVQWDMIMSVLSRLSGLTDLNNFTQFQKVLCGGMDIVNINGKELAVPLGKFFIFSSSTLTCLHMR